MRRTKIICTIGPVTNSEEKLLELAKNGMNLARFNMSHGEHDWHGEAMDRVKKINKEYGYNIGILLDTKGPEIRSGDLKENIVLKQGDTLTITTDKSKLDQPNTTGINYPGFMEDVQIGDKVLVDSGLMNLETISKDSKNVVLKALDDGILTSRRHLNILGRSASLETITDKDWADINFGIQMSVDYFALSFVKDAAGILELRDYLDSRGSNIKIISKLETSESVKNLEEIVMVSDAIMVARGDLGAELPIEEVPLIQDEMVEVARAMNKPVIVATQLLETMMQNPTPTRAEVTDIANAVKAQADAIMLSGETAGGKYPIKAVQTMNKVATHIEQSVIGGYPSFIEDSGDVEKEVVMGGCMIANNIDAKVIIVLTRRGYTAQLISQCRPAAPIYALTDSHSTANKLSLYWGVKAEYFEFSHKAEENVQKAVQFLIDTGVLQKGEIAVVISDMLAGQDIIDTVQIRRAE